jgi:hypothetical protein
LAKAATFTGVFSSAPSIKDNMLEPEQVSELYHERARHLEAMLTQLIDAAKFDQDKQSWSVRFTQKYLNELRESLGMREVGPDEGQGLLMWPEKPND